MLKANKCTIPEEGLYIIRYHSFYPWHQKKGYEHLASEQDLKNLDWLLKFQKCDLYSKLPQVPDRNKLQPYYEQLVATYFPGGLKLRW